MANRILLRLSLFTVRFISLILPALSWVWKIVKWVLLAFVIFLLLLLIV